ncbi:unnamed protein product [Dimorphilus gyrociliatus]|uniref:L-Fucosyltransferase n=1 Tax=Dimorphilus gyrociliatus TaxID=2664684 RepID=A0A7I8V5B4_9ANNE|nr:unnamed protein product [Dimorphilus gyrociliatus]
MFKYIFSKYLFVLLSVPVLIIVYENNMWNFFNSRVTEDSYPTIQAMLKPAPLNETLFVYGRGRLGNLMFIFAAGLGLAAKTSKTLRVSPYFWDRGRCFNIPPEFIMRNRFNKKLQKSVVLREELPRKFSSSMVKQISQGINKQCYAYGFLQSWKYFENVEHEIRNFFKQKFKTKKAGLNYVNQLKKSKRPIVGIHVRLRDTANDKRLRKGTKEYFTTATTLMKKLLGNRRPLFVLLTNDRLKVQEQFKEMIDSEEATLTPEHLSDRCVELEILSSCDHTIITHGTFGWWGAFLSNGYTIYIKNYAVENLLFYNITVPEDFFPKDWIGLNV